MAGVPTDNATITKEGSDMVYEEFSDLCRRVTRTVVGEVPTAVFVESPNPDAMMHKPSDPVVVQPSGILLQRCGGGHRVLRKRIGAS